MHARGHFESAERHIRVALSHVEAAEAPDEHADTLLDLMRILHAQGRDGEARGAAEEALRVAEERESFVFADRAREFLASSAPVVLAD